MSASNFAPCCDVTLDFEGGNDDDPHDPGGRTSRGITQREWNSYRRAHGEVGLAADVWRAPQSAIVDIYRQEYWYPVAGDQWPRGLDLCVYDAGVNSGAGKALAWARTALAQGEGTFNTLAALASITRDKAALIHRYQARRSSFLHALRTWAYFGRGWARRVAGIEAIAIKWSLQDQGRPAEAVSDTLVAKSETAAKQAQRAGNGALVAPTTAGGARAASEHVDWTAIAIDLAIFVVVAAIVAYLVHRWYVQRERAKAMLEASK